VAIYILIRLLRSSLILDSFQPIRLFRPSSLALFVLTFMYTPDLVTERGGAALKIDQQSTGAFSPPIVGNTGNIHIDGGTAKKP
jgi:hypothetical protein